jgi:ribosome assembly protein 4
VNTLAVHTDYVLRTGPFDEFKKEFTSKEDMQDYAIKRYNKSKGSNNERLVSGSDDFTLYLWDPIAKSEPIIRMTGHQQPVNHVNKL